MPAARIVGVLLAGGRGERFGGGKLLAPVRSAQDDVVAGTPVGVAACRHLAASLPETIAVVRPGDAALVAALTSAGARVIVCERADEGMGASLACGVAATPEADGWVVALADMPWVRPATIAAVTAGLAAGADIVTPRYEGQRGHPVGFSRRHGVALAALRGDEGARAVVPRHAATVQSIDVDDPGVLRDVDHAADL
jgi:molybdenum cofactor cytidylyltransferase